MERPVKKISKLYSDNSYYNSHGLENVLFSFSHHLLKELEKSLLSRGLNFALLPKNLSYADYILPIELSFRDIELYEFPVRTNNLYVVG